MAAESLRQQLLSLPGVAEADVDLEGGAPANVRIRLAPGAEGPAVGLEVQRVLASYGMRSRVDAGEEMVGGVAPAVGAGELPVESPAALAGDGPGSPAGAGPVSISLEEGPGGVLVTVTAGDGRRASGRGEASERGLAEAVTAALGNLAAGTLPGVVAVEWLHADGSAVVTVVLDRPDGTRAAGAAVVRASHALAVARAAWAALTS